VTVRLSFLRWIDDGIGTVEENGMILCFHPQGLIELASPELG